MTVSNAASNRDGKPIVYFDANPLNERHLTGIGRYTARLAMAVSHRANVRFFAGQWELQVSPDMNWSQDQDLQQFARRISRSRRVPLGQPPAESLGVWCCLRPIERWFPTEVSILYDFTPLIVPATHTPRVRLLYQGFSAQSLLSTDLALAISHSTKADASWLTDLDQDRIFVSHPGPSLCVEKHVGPAHVQRSKNIGLVVSTLEPRKNAPRLLEWFHSTEVLPNDAELWWVGPRGWLTSRRQLRHYRKRGGQRRVRLLGVVSDAKLCELTRKAAWSIYPSLYEGFGFPVLDALRHGTPVLTSYHSSLREFSSPGLHFFDPCAPATFDEAWTQMDAAGDVEIDQQSLDRLYNWDAVACKLLDEHQRYIAKTQKIAA